MTLKDAIRSAHVNKGHIYTTDELWEDDENCILVDNLGNLVFGNGEPVTDDSTLPSEGWYDATDIEEQSDKDDWSFNTSRNHHEDVLWDEEDY